MATWTTLSVLDWTTQRFTDAGISSARLEAQLLLSHVLQCTRTQLYMQFDKPLAEPELVAYRGLIKRRLAGEPVAYLLGEHEFWGLPVFVDANVLVPRPDTETLVEVALALCADRAAPWRVLDLCTGSGAVALALAKELPCAALIATDVSAAALAIARKNVERNAFVGRIELREGDLFAAVASEPPFDLITANPPYIATRVIASLSAEVKREPVLALDGGADGLVFYDRICGEAIAHLVPGGVLVVEHGYDQANTVRERFEGAGFIEIALTHDLAKNPRITAGRRPLT